MPKVYNEIPEKRRVLNDGEAYYEVQLNESLIKTDRTKFILDVGHIRYDANPKAKYKVPKNEFWKKLAFGENPKLEIIGDGVFSAKKKVEAVPKPKIQPQTPTVK